MGVALELDQATKDLGAYQEQLKDVEGRIAKLQEPVRTGEQYGPPAPPPKATGRRLMPVPDEREMKKAADERKKALDMFGALKADDTEAVRPLAEQQDKEAKSRS